MKTSIIRLSGLLILLMGLALSFTQCTELSGAEEDSATVPELSEAESNGILFMREEEKLARDVYIYLYEIYPLRPFLNISKSEQAHMDAMMFLIDTFDLVDPVGENLEGVFQNEDLQELYNELIEQGSESREEALKVGALIEEVDIIDLQAELEDHAVNEEVIRVYTNLCRASENHLRAFVGVLKIYDVNYEPVLLEPAEYKRILAN
jgi:hypothetical protein